jgi:hypothetical protein
MLSLTQDFVIVIVISVLLCSWVRPGQRRGGRLSFVLWLPSVAVHLDGFGSGSHEPVVRTSRQLPIALQRLTYRGEVDPPDISADPQEVSGAFWDGPIIRLRLAICAGPAHKDES